MDSVPDSASVSERLEHLEARIARLEELIHSRALRQEPGEPAPAIPGEETGTAETLEFRIGTNWFAKLGIVTLALGFGFLLTLPFPGLPPVAPGVAGCTLAIAIIALAQYRRDALAHISGYVLGSGIVVLYLAILRLAFFGNVHAVEAGGLLTALLATAAGAGFLLAVRRGSAHLAALCLALGYATGLIADSVAVLFPGVVLLSIVAVLFDRKFVTSGLLAFAAGMNLLTLLVWMMNTPVLGRSVQVLHAPSFSPLILLVGMLVIAAGSLQRRQQGDPDNMTTLTSAVNGAGSYLLFLFMTMAAFTDSPVLMHAVAHAGLLATATFFWMRNRSLYSTFLYVMPGYMAMTVAVIKQFPSPDYFIWLSWQSLMVVATAVWFRSRFIVVANFFIYLMLFAAYLIVAGSFSLISLSFGIVALLTARILNAYKHRLALTTELMRNAYLGCAFFILPYTLYNTVPKEVVSLSWLAVALFYYIMSRVVRSTKYRWMALLTLMLTAVHVLAVDITNLDPAYKIVSFIVIGVVLLGISVRYARQRDAKTGRPGPSPHARDDPPVRARS